MPAGDSNSKIGAVSFFSTRSVCTTCASAIAFAQKTFSQNVAFVPFELKAEDRGQQLSEIYMFLAKTGSQGGLRDTAAQQGSVSLNV
jgi:hypothetical protein